MNENSNETVFRARTLPGGRFGRHLLLLWAAGMGGMFAGLLLTLGHPLGGMAGLVIPIFWLSLKLTRRAEYGVGAGGVRETLLDAQGKADVARERRYRWDEVESWLVDADLVRGTGSRRFVDLRLRDGYRMRFREANERPDDPEFTAFAEALAAYAGGAAEVAASAHAAPTPHPTRQPTAHAPSAPVQRRSFYRTPFARFLTTFFLILTVGLLAAAVLLPQYFGGSAWFRLVVVIIPGTLYMAMRSFGRR